MLCLVEYLVGEIKPVIIEVEITNIDRSKENNKHSFSLNKTIMYYSKEINCGQIKLAVSTIMLLDRFLKISFV